MNMRENTPFVGTPLNPEPNSVYGRVQLAMTLLDKGRSEEDIGKGLGLPKKWADRYIRLARELNRGVVELLDYRRKCVTPPSSERGRITFGMAELIVVLKKERQLEVAQVAIQSALSYEEVQALIEEDFVARISIGSGQTPEIQRLLRDLDACIAQVNMLRYTQGLNTEATNALIRKAYRLQEMVGGMEVSNNLGVKLDPHSIPTARSWKAQATPQELLQWFASFAR